MVVSAGVLLILGGLCACAPLFRRVSKALEKFLAVIGFFFGIVALVLAVDYALSLNLLSNVIQIPTEATVSSLSSPYLKYFLPAMIILGVLLVSRPLRNVRWASLISLAVGSLVLYLLHALLPSLSSTILVVAFFIAAVAVYMLLKFVEDVFKLVSSILAFPPIAIIIGLVNIYFGILFFSV